jgi:hypothetical protein
MKEFSYLKIGEHYYPVVKIELIGPLRSFITSALVDSGASVSVFEPEVAKVIGIEIKKGKSLFIEGIGGKAKAFLHQIPIKFLQKEFNLKIAFFEKPTLRINILGRDNFFLPFLITFKERVRKILVNEVK